jgi:hypothetical protein
MSFGLDLDPVEIISNQQTEIYGEGALVQSRCFFAARALQPDQLLTIENFHVMLVRTRIGALLRLYRNSAEQTCIGSPPAAKRFPLLVPNPATCNRDDSGGPTRGPIEGRPIWILSIIYTPEESMGRPPPAGTPAALTYDLTLASLTTKPNLR